MAVSRLRLYDFIHSRGPATVGLCASDTVGCANLVNSATQRLLFARATNDTGFWGAFAELAFNVDREDPFIVLPRGIARLIDVDVCTYPVPVQNGFFEYLLFGSGRFPKTSSNCQTGPCEPLQAYSRGLVATFGTIVEGHRVRVRPSDVADAGLRTLIGGLDGNDQKVTNLDGPVLVQGEFVSFTLPFADTVTPWNRIDAIQKDVTVGPVSYYDLDPDTGDERLLLTMEPGEKVAGYRRYYLGGLPRNCCAVPDASATTVQITAMCKLDYVEVVVPTDYLLVQNLEALIAECQSIRFSEMDSPNAVVKEAERHRAAIRLLNGQTAHYEGQDSVAVNFAPFGSAHLSCQRIGALI